MNRLKSFRVFLLLAILLVSLIVLLLREHRPSFLHPGLKLNAYVSSADGSVTVVDLVSLRAIAKVFVGPGIADMREHAKRPEIWGVSSNGGYIWILDAASNNVAARIPVGPFPLSVDFSPAGDRAYTTSANSDQLIAIDCA